MSTIKLYYKDAYIRDFKARVISCEGAGDGSGDFLLELDATAFYPEGGGQPSDTGYINGIEVLHVSDNNGRILHRVKEKIGAGEAVSGSIDWKARFDHMQQHSGEHIVSGMICSAFNCDNVGFHMGADTVVIDFNAEIGWEKLMEIEHNANAYIWENHALEVLWPDKEELKNIHYRSKKEIDGDVRLTRFPGADICACCGTHVSYSGEVGMVKFLSCHRFHEGSRIELLCGERVYRYLTAVHEQNSAIAKGMAAKYYDTARVYFRQLEELKNLKARSAALENELFSAKAEMNRGKGDVLLFEEELTPDSVRKLCVAVGSACGGLCAVFSRDADGSRTNGSQTGGYKYAIMHEGHDISGFIKEMNTALKGRGGGRNGLAQGSVEAGRKEIQEFFGLAVGQDGQSNSDR